MCEASYSVTDQKRHDVPKVLWSVEWNSGAALGESETPKPTTDALSGSFSARPNPKANGLGWKQKDRSCSFACVPIAQLKSLIVFY